MINKPVLIYESTFIHKRGDGCGRFWNLSSKVLLLYDESQKLGSIGTEEKFFFNLNNTDKSPQKPPILSFPLVGWLAVYGGFAAVSSQAAPPRF